LPHFGATAQVAYKSITWREFAGDFMLRRKADWGADLHSGFWG
jgi:hypothetical protein